MVPAVLAVMETLPLSTNGKIDRKAVADRLVSLAAPREIDGEPPQGLLEQRVAAIWSEVLKQDRIRRGDDFFRLGGDSLLATQVVARLRHQSLSANQPLRLLFARPALAAFAAGLGEGAEPVAMTVVSDEAHRHEPFPLTEVQRAYVMGQNSGVARGCGTTYVIELDGNDVDLARIEDAWNSLVQRHEMLRAVLTEDGQQRILPSVPRVTIGIAQGCADDPAAASRLLRARREGRGTDRTRWPLFDLSAVRYGRGRCRLGLSFDYVLLDGFSVKILLAELAELYRDPRRALPPTDLSFRDYVLQIRPAPGETVRDEAYWRSRLDDLPPAPALPLAVDPAAIATVRFHRREMRLPARRWQDLRARAGAQGVTPSVLLLTAYAETLSQWSGGGALTLNLTLFDRRDVHPDIHKVLGDFTSLAPITFRPQAGQSFLAQAQGVQQEMAEVLEHRSVSSIWVQRERARRLGLAAAALPVVFTSTLGLADNLFHDLPPDFPTLAGGGFSETPQVWLDHQVYELDGGLLLAWDSVDGLFPAGLLDAMFAAYGRLVDTLAEEAASWDRPVPAGLPRQQQLAREAANGTATPRIERTLHQAVFDRALSHPGRPALFDGDAVVSYGELRRRALQVAAGLKAAGAGEGTPVAVSLARGADQIVAVFGILAAGGCYVPVGLSQPEARRERICGTAGVRHVVTAGFMSRCRHVEPLEHPVSVSPASPAYVIFTSGSTGDPKGVEIAHHSACHTIVDVSRRYGSGAG
ncbi:MAG: AMP-binding protein, partial [Methanobacterium sp.]|nr:AMP-binding protein [Methanobacterium sp.]